jgi:hypothetical protein
VVGSFEHGDEPLSKKNAGKFLDGCTTCSLLRRAQYHGVNQSVKHNRS